MNPLGGVMVPIGIVAILGAGGMFAWSIHKASKVGDKSYERGLKMVPLLIHLPPITDDVDGEGKDARAVAEEEISVAESMYGIIASTVNKSSNAKFFGQKAISFEVVARSEGIEYYIYVPISLVEIARQAVTAAYPTARLEAVDDPNIFNQQTGRGGTAGGEMILRTDAVYPIATYKETKKDAALAIINALSVVKAGDGVGMQVLVRPMIGDWKKRANDAAKQIRDGRKVNSSRSSGGLAYFPQIFSALWTPPGAKDPEKKEEKEPLTNAQQAEIEAIEDKVRYPCFEVVIRLVASSSNKAKAESILNGLVAVFAQFNSSVNNGFQYNILRDTDAVAMDYMLRRMPKGEIKTILNSVELATIYHLPSQNAIPTSKVQKQMFRQVDGPAMLPEEGVLLGVNEFRGEKKEIRLDTTDRRRHLYMIGGTGVGKTGFLHNLAYQDMMDGRGFAFLDPHGDAVEELMSMVPEERIDDIIYFDPGDMSNPIGMNMFEFTDPDQKDFIVQEGINMLYSLYDPGHTGIFGPRGEHIFRNAALLLMSDPAGGTFVDVPRVLIDPDYRNTKLQYVTDKTVYDFWTKEWPASQKSSEAGEVTSWFVSKWGPFLSNTMMRNIIGQTKSGFNIRQIMDGGKILLVNLSKGKMGELNSKLLGMIFVMKFQAAAMSRADTPESERKDFCLFVDEFQNFSTESFESILSEARKYRLSLVLANQFMTQLTDKIREAIIGNIGTIISGRIGITDAELLQKAFTGVFTAEDLARLPNYQAVAKVLINSVPSAPFSMSLLPPMGEQNKELFDSMKGYTAAMYGRPRAEVDAEINARVMGGSVEAEKKREAASASANEPKPVAEPSKKELNVRKVDEEEDDFVTSWGKKQQQGSVVNNTTPEAAKDDSVVEMISQAEPMVERAEPANDEAVDDSEAVVKNTTDRTDDSHNVRKGNSDDETHVQLR